jgi:hypothetical protein
MANESIQTFVQAQMKTYERCLHGDLKCDGKAIPGLQHAFEEPY